MQGSIHEWLHTFGTQTSGRTEVQDHSPQYRNTFAVAVCRRLSASFAVAYVLGISINTTAIRLERETVVFLSIGFVSAQLQGYSNLRLGQSLAKTQKSMLRVATGFIRIL
jgi:hypothetical protein